MKLQALPLAGLSLIEPQVFRDERGEFAELCNIEQLSQALGHSLQFVQDNHSQSIRGVLRGLHYQVRKPQGKLLRVVSGAVHDVVVDMRRGSATVGQWFGLTLQAGLTQLWIPPGFAHGFLSLQANTVLHYKVTSAYDPGDEQVIHWRDSELAIDWPLEQAGVKDEGPLLSPRDRAGRRWRDAPLCEPCC